MAKIIDMTGLQQKSWSCAKCGTKLWNDHGWILDDGSVVCRREDKCHSTVIAAKIAAEKAAGIIPAWRKKGESK